MHPAQIQAAKIRAAILAARAAAAPRKIDRPAAAQARWDAWKDQNR